MPNNQTPYDFDYDALCKNYYVNSAKYTFVWEISEFSSRAEENGEYLKSPHFNIKVPGGTISEWHVNLYPRGNVSTDSNHVSVFLCNDSSNDYFTKFNLSTINSNQKKNLFCYIPFSKIKSKSNGGRSNALYRPKLPQHTFDDKLILVLGITIRGEINESIELAESSRQNDGISKILHQDQFCHDLGLLYNNNEYADTTVTCGGKKFDCHKIILASRSPVFKTMLESNMKEKITGSIEIKGMRIEVFESLLQYIYTSDAPNIDTLARDLYAAADQYQIVKLKELCEAKLISNIDLENCIGLLVLGDLHQASALKQAALKFVSQNMDEIDPDEWKKTLIAYPALLIEMMEMMIPKKVDSNVSDQQKRAPFS